MEKCVSEEELNQKMVAPRVTLEAIENEILDERYFNGRTAVDNWEEAQNPMSRQASVAFSSLTFCTLVLKNGFTVTGQSACVSPENYDEEIGKRVARGDAIRQVWPLMAYELRSKLNRLEQLDRELNNDKLGEALTRMTAYGLGNPDAFNAHYADVILTHFMDSDHSEEGNGGATFAKEIVEPAVDNLMGG